VTDPTDTSSTVTVVLGGEIDLATAADMRRRLFDDTSADVVVADLAGVGFMDSSGLRALLEVRSRLLAEGRTLTLVNLPAQVRRLFEIAGTGHLFDGPAGP
jgi:anti-sigma B factor antagonist